MAKKEHIKMPRAQRAKQFAPFDALDGFGVAIKRKEEEHEEELRLLQEGEPEPDETAEKYKRGFDADMGDRNNI